MHYEEITCATTSPIRGEIRCGQPFRSLSTPLHARITIDDDPGIVGVLAAADMNIDILNLEVHSALILAAALEPERALRYLLSGGAISRGGRLVTPPHSGYQRQG